MKNKSIIAGLVGVILATAMVLCIACENGTQDVNLVGVNDNLVQNVKLNDTSDVNVVNEHAKIKSPTNVKAQQGIITVTPEWYQGGSRPNDSIISKIYLNYVLVEWTPVTDAVSYTVYVRRKDSTGFVSTWVGSSYANQGPGLKIGTNRTNDGDDASDYSGIRRFYYDKVDFQVVNYEAGIGASGNTWAIKVTIGSGSGGVFSGINYPVPTDYASTLSPAYTASDVNNKYQYCFGVAANNAISNSDTSITSGSIQSEIAWQVDATGQEVWFGLSQGCEYSNYYGY